MLCTTLSSSLHGSQSSTRAAWTAHIYSGLSTTWLQTPQFCRGFRALLAMCTRPGHRHGSDGALRHPSPSALCPARPPDGFAEAIGAGACCRIVPVAYRSQLYASAWRTARWKHLLISPLLASYMDEQERYALLLADSDWLRPRRASAFAGHGSLLLCPVCVTRHLPARVTVYLYSHLL